MSQDSMCIFLTQLVYVNRVTTSIGFVASVGFVVDDEKSLDASGY